MTSVGSSIAFGKIVRLHNFFSTKLCCCQILETVASDNATSANTFYVSSALWLKQARAVNKVLFKNSPSVNGFLATTKISFRSSKLHYCLSSRRDIFMICFLHSYDSIISKIKRRDVNVKQFHWCFIYYLDFREFVTKNLLSLTYLPTAPDYNFRWLIYDLLLIYLIICGITESCKSNWL